MILRILLVIIFPVLTVFVAMNSYSYYRTKVSKVKEGWLVTYWSLVRVIVQFAISLSLLITTCLVHWGMAMYLMTLGALIY